MNLKVLPLDSWMLSLDHSILHFELEETLKYYERIDPVHNRPGRYRLGNKCWFELGDGRAFSEDRKMFDFDIKVANAFETMPTDIAALNAVVKSKFATKKQRELQRLIVHAYEIRKVRRDTAKTMLRFHRNTVNQ